MTSQDLLVRWTRERDEIAFRELVGRHAPMVFATAKRILSNESEAEDVIQECFESLAVGRSRPRGHVGAWLHRTATNRCIDRMRSTRQRTKREEAYMSGRTGSTPLEWNDVYDLVDAAIADLPRRLRAPVVGYFLEGRSNADIAKELGVSRQTVSVRVRKGVELIQKQLTNRGVQVSIVSLTAMLGQQAAAAAVPVTVTAKLGKLALAAKSTVVSGANTMSIPGGFFTMNVVGFSVVTLLTLGLFLISDVSNGGPTATHETQVAAVANEEDFAVVESEGDQEPVVAQADAEDFNEVSNDPPVRLAHETAVGLLHSELKRFQGRANVVYAFETSYELVGGNEGSNASLRETKRGVVRRSGDRLEIESLDDKWYEEIDGFRQVRHEHRVWKDGRALGIRNYMEPSGRSQSQAYTTKSKLHDRVRPDMIGWFLDGVYVDSDHYAENLMTSRDLTASRDPGDSERIRIGGTTHQGRTVVWLDAAAPHVLRRARFEAGSRLLDELSGIDGFTLDVTVERYEEVDGVRIPSAGVGTYTYEMPDESAPIAKQFTVRRSDFRVDPDFDATDAFRVDFPENTVIFDYDNSDMKYRWVNGKRLPYPDWEPGGSLSAPIEPDLPVFAESRKSQDADHVAVGTNASRQLELTLRGKALHDEPHLIDLRGVESRFVEPMYAAIRENGYLDVVFAFKGAKDASRRIRLDVTLNDVDGNALKSFSRDCKDQRIAYDRVTARGTIRLGMGGSVVPVAKENHEEFWTLHIATRSILFSAEEVHIMFEEAAR